jgi:hypothetical protein
MAEEAAQEQPSPTVSRPVRCIVKLGTLPGSRAVRRDMPRFLACLHASLALAYLRSYGG